MGKSLRSTFYENISDWGVGNPKSEREYPDDAYAVGRGSRAGLAKEILELGQTEQVLVLMRDGQVNEYTLVSPSNPRLDRLRKIKEELLAHDGYNPANVQFIQTLIDEEQAK